MYQFPIFSSGSIQSAEEMPIYKPQYYNDLWKLSLKELGFDVTGFEDIAIDVIEGCMDWVMQYTGINIQKERREELDGSGNTRLVLRHFPAQQLLSVQVLTIGHRWIDITPHCRLTEEGEVLLYQTSFYWHFPVGDKNVTVRYIAGLTRIPPLMRLVVIELAQNILLKYGVIGAIAIQDNPLIAEILDGVVSGSTTTSGSGGVDAEVSQSEATKRIKSVSIKSLSVTFTDDIRTTSDILRNPLVKRSVITKLIDDLLSQDESAILKRLKIMAKVYTNG